MTRARPQPTLADYMAIAISPALIIVLVGSLAFFLLTIFYAGQFENRMYWTTACFVFAAVLISRISIVEGAERASMFGLALGVAAALAMVRFAEHPWWGWCVLGVIWWSASHLVWNCTLVDDEDDASGEGLLEAASLDAAMSDGGGALAAGEQANRPKSKRGKQAPAARPTPPQPWAKRFFGWWQKSLSRSAPPGLTVVYFSLAALPIFGLGQYFVAPDDRQYAFKLMVRYVASALGLLLTTSFLGLRRYLRQRRLEMPLEMTGTWLGLGAAMALAILIVAMLIPRPNPEYAVSSLTGWLSSPQREASSYAPLGDSPGQGDSSSTAPANDQTQIDQQQDQSQGQGSSSPADGRSREGGQQATSMKGSQPPTGSSQSGQKSTPGQGGSTSPAQGAAGKSSDSQGEKQQTKAEASNSPQAQQDHQGQSAQSQNAAQTSSAQEDQQTDQQPPATTDAAKQQSSQSNTGQKDEKRAQNPQSPSQQQASAKMAQAMSQHAHQAPSFRPPSLSMGGWLLWLFKMLLYLAVLVAGLYCLVRYWPQVKAFLLGLWRELVDLWNGLFGKRRAGGESAVAAQEQRPKPRPFASFQDPFAGGVARSKPPNAVVQYSFEALEAWAAERGLERMVEETPLEFASRIAAKHAPLANEVQELASLYARVAYAREALTPDNLGGVARLWASLRKTAQPMVTARAT